MQLRPFKFKASSLFVWITGGVSLFFLVTALYAVWGYLRLSQRAEADVYHWKVVQIDPSHYGIKATYRFEVKGQMYKGKTFFSKPYHLNLESVEKQVSRFLYYKWSVWYQPSHPEISSLERKFPAKQLIYTFVTVALFFYFLRLRRQVEQFVN